MDSAKAKQALYRKDRVFTPTQQSWIDIVLDTFRRSSKERLLIEQLRDILIHLQVPRDMLISLGSGTTETDEVLDDAALLVRVKLLMHDAGGAFPGDDAIIRKLRLLAEFCGATRAEMLRVLYEKPE